MSTHEAFERQAQNRGWLGGFFILINDVSVGAEVKSLLHPPVRGMVHEYYKE